MAKFVVHITETLGRDVIIEAEDPAEAEEIAENLCNDGTINLVCEDFGSRNVEAIRTATPDDEEYIKEVYRDE